MRFTAWLRAGLAMSSNGEIFQQFMHEAYGIEPDPEQEEKPTGPRKPAPVPEAGHAGPSPMAAEAEARHTFHEKLQHYFNIHY